MRTSRLITAPLAAAITVAALASPAAATDNQLQSGHTGKSASATRLPGPPTWPVNPQPLSRPHADVDEQSQTWTPTKTQIRSALAQERYYMSFGRH